MAKIHPTAIIDPSAELAEDVVVGPYCIVEGGVRIGSGTELRAHVVVQRGTELKGNNLVDTFVSLGGSPQDFSYKKGTPTGLVIGEGSVIRDSAVIHRATREDRPTQLGKNVYVMNQVHIGHDVQIGDHVVVAGGAMMAGHVEIGDYVVIGGMAAIHQWVRVGTGAMVGGAGRFSRDIPPYGMAVERNELSGLNLVGLRRRGVKREIIAELKDCYRAIVMAQGNPVEQARMLLGKSTLVSAEAKQMAQFYIDGKRHFCSWRGGSFDD
jgi:UDP-N-acetylglucosamine acyltransferase